MREVELPGGERLVIRPVAAGDVDGLQALYADLDDEARYRRFFTAHRPDREFFERLTTIEERGGAGIVAELDSGRIVAEAGYELLANGDGELAIVVAGDWRGWLGPYLLGSLVEAAAAHGVPNLEADVLVTNRPMLALLRSRGNAVVPNDDWTVLRATIGTATSTATWPPPQDGHGLRILVEGASSHWHDATAAKEAGVEVLGCPGPGRGRPGCPALAGEPCPLAAGADAIFIAHPLDDETWRDLRAAHRRVHPGVPVCIEHRRYGH